MGWRRRLRARDICVSIAIASGVVGSGCSTIKGGADDPACQQPPCGTPGADGGERSPDGGGGDGDGGTLVLGDFSEPTAIPALAGPASGEGDPSLTEDGRELYFSSDRTGGGGGGSDIWVSKRDSVLDDWGPPDPVLELNSADAEFDPEVSADGLTMWMNSTRAVAGAQGGFDLFVTTRETRDDDWGDPQLMTSFNTADNEMGAVMNAAKTVVVFHRVVAGVYSLHQSIRASEGGGWSDPEPLDELNADPIADAYLSTDGLTIYFNSTRDGGKGSWDIWRATRESVTAPFGEPEPVAEVNSDVHDANVGLSNKTRYLVMTSARSGEQEIYEASR